MAKRCALATAAALLCATMTWAQSPQSQQPQPQPRPPQTQPPGDDDRPGGQEPRTPEPARPGQAGTQATMTLVGCLRAEEDVPGREPNVAERAGIAEDFILTDASAQGQGQPTGTTGRAGAPGTAGTTGTAARARGMFEIEGLDDDELRKHVGQRVEVTGRLESGAAGAGQPGTTGTTGDRPGAAGQAGRSTDDLPQFQATSIRQVPGDCPPAAQQPGQQPQSQPQPRPQQPQPEQERER